ncbi:MAG TPA: DUF488 family protein [Nitrospirota bacterium]|nr:DUF488 family protein [Nitrospirota bacterium]
MIRLKRIYDPPSRGDGRRILVDRLWPRGVKKDEAQIDEWFKDIAPSDALRRWFGHDPDKWPAFKLKYQKELKARGELIRRIRSESRSGTVTFLFAAKDAEHNNAVVLKEQVERKS